MVTEKLRETWPSVLARRDYSLIQMGPPNWLVRERQWEGESFLAAAKRVREEEGIPPVGGSWPTADKPRTEATADITTDMVFCDGCEGPVTQSGHGPKKRFCSDACRKRVSRG